MRRAYSCIAGTTGPAEETFVDFVYQPMRGPKGDVVGILVHGVDVKRAAKCGGARRLPARPRRCSAPAHRTRRKSRRRGARLLGEYLGADRCAYADVEEDEDTVNLVGDYNRGVPSIVGRYRFRIFGAEVLQLMRGRQTLRRP
jgi:hypothetical protein